VSLLITPHFFERVVMQELMINPKDEVCAVKATNRQALVEWMKENNIDVSETNYIHIELSGKECCGGVLDCKTIDDVPYHSVPCPCGNPKHWLIKYEEE
jgi:hypothetical protein